MSTSDHTARRSNRSPRWLVPGLCVVFGFVYLIIGLANDKAGFGITGLLIMLGYGAILIIFRRRSEAISLLGGDLSDERRVAIQQQVGATTGYVLVVAIVLGALWSISTDSDSAGVFVGLAALGGLTVIGSSIWYSHRG